MAKNYIKRSNYQSHSRLLKSAFLTFSIFIITFTILLTLYHKKLHHIYSKNKTINLIARMPKSEPHTPTTAQPRFDFYTLLPKMQVLIPKSENREAIPRN